jgi:hypothetical protein
MHRLAIFNRNKYRTAMGCNFHQGLQSLDVPAHPALPGMNAQAELAIMLWR